MKLNMNVQKTVALWGREYKKGMTAYLILLFLRKERLYGYQLTALLTDLMNHRILFKENAIYTALKQLHKKGFVTCEWRKSEKGPKRKYYTITDSGKQILEVFTENYIAPMLNGLSSLVLGQAGFQNEKIGGNNDRENT